VTPLEPTPWTRRREALLLGACVAVYLVLAGIRAWDHTHPDYDDVGFLDLANQVRDMGGPVALFQALFTGAWTEDNRNPLYLAVLSLVAGIGVPPATGVVPDAASFTVAGLRPPIVWKPIPFGARRKAEMAAYSKRHYGQHSWRLRDPKVIIEHYTDGTT